MVLAVYRLALTSIPFVWLVADSLGWFVGRATGSLTGGPLHVGATFAGLDFLLAMGYLTLRSTLAVEYPRRRKVFLAVVFLVVIIVLHGGYLTVLRYSTDLLAVAAPESAGGAAAPSADFGTDAPKSFTQHARDMAAAIPDAVHWHVPRAGHMLPGQAPDVITAAIKHAAALGAPTTRPPRLCTARNVTHAPASPPHLPPEPEPASAAKPALLKYVTEGTQ